MALFCPSCHNLLLLRNDMQLRFYCRTCPYILNINGKVTNKTILKPKEAEEAYDMNAEPKGAVTQAACPRCTHDSAYFYQVQIRSADEPMTQFYRCVKCSFRWREG